MDTVPRRSPATMPGFHKGREPGNKGLTFPPEVLRPAEVKALLRAAHANARDPAIGARNRALFTVLYRAGLRISEALSLRPVDIDGEGGYVTVMRGKGGKRRTVGLDPAALRVVTDWMEIRREAWKLDDITPLFPTAAGARMKDSYVRELMKRLAVSVGIERRVHPHQLRHTFAAELAREGFPMPYVQLLLGHSSLATTSRYLATIAPEEAVARIRGRTWDGAGDEAH